jgi:hypothetical protein
LACAPIPVFKLKSYFEFLVNLQLPWEEDNDYIRSGHRNQDEFRQDTFRTITLSGEEGIKAVIAKQKGKNTMEVVSYLFEKSKGWTLGKAKEWFEKHQNKNKESFKWFGNIRDQPGVRNLIRGKALHPIRTYHPEEWPQVREYLEDELQKSAPTLTGKPLLLDHFYPLRGEVLGAEYNDGAIEYVAKLDDPEVLGKIKDGKIKQCSVEFEWKSLEQVDGIAPRGLNFTGLSLLESFEPGDPRTTVEVWEAIVAGLKESKHARSNIASLVKEQASAEPNEFIFYLIRDPAAFLEERFSSVWVDQTNGIQGLYGYLREKQETLQPMALLFMKANNWTLEKMQGWLRDHPQYVRQSQPQSQLVAASAGIQPANVTMEKKKPAIVEAILPSETELNLQPSDFVSKKEILSLLPERVPIHWGYGPTELVRRLKNKLE